MKIKLLILMVLGFASISTYGFLEFNDVKVDLQKIGVFNSVEQFTGGFNCACTDPGPDGIHGTADDGGFDPGFCNTNYSVPPDDGPDGEHGTADDNPGVPAPGSLGLAGNMLCTWETNGDNYGGLLGNDEEQGCKPNYWLSIMDSEGSYQWPAGFSPEYEFDSIFHTTLAEQGGNSNGNGNSGSTLEDALKHQGNWVNKPGAPNLARAASAAILNSEHYEVDYPYSVQEVISMTQVATTSGTYHDTAKLFDNYNKLGHKLMCP